MNHKNSFYHIREREISGSKQWRRYLDQVKWNYNPKIDSGYFKVCANSDTLVCVVVKSNISCLSYCFDQDAQNHINEELTNIIKAKPQHNKSVYIVPFLSGEFIEQGVKQIGQYLQTHSNELERGTIALFKECCRCNLAIKWTAPCPLLPNRHTMRNFVGINHTLISLDESCAKRNMYRPPTIF